MRSERERAFTLPVIATKLTPPHLPPMTVARPALSSLVAEPSKVTAVVAPAGYGKTVLIRQWLDGLTEGRPVAWFSLDVLDANPLSFWRHVIAALDGALGIGPEPEAILLDRGAEDPAFLHALVHCLEAGAGDAVLVLDDLHLLRNPTALRHVAVLVERTPPPFHVVVVARSDPGLPLARWRAQGWLTELREDALRFREDEAAALLREYVPDGVDEEDVRELVARTEGWVAGLQLAALSRPDGRVADALRGFRGNGRLVSAYLVNEVLAHLPAEQRAVALAVSVVDEVDVASAVALSGRSDAGAVLDAMCDANVFVVPVGPEDGTYRFHTLFRELLEHDLRASEPVRWEALRRRAAELDVTHGRLDAAFGHYRRIGDIDAAFNLVVRPALALLDRGGSRDVRRWLEQLPGDLEVSDPGRMLALSFANFAAARLADAEAWCERAAALLPADDLRVTTRRLAIAIANGDLDRATVLSRGAQVAGASGDLEQRAGLIVARVHLALRDLPSALAALDRARDDVTDDIALSVALPALRARCLIAAGALVDGRALARSARDAATALSAVRSPATLEMLLALVEAAIAEGSVDEAATLEEELMDTVDALEYRYARAYTVASIAAEHAARYGWAALATEFDDLAQRAGATAPLGFSLVLDPLRVRALAAAGHGDEALALAEVLPEGYPRRLSVAAALLAARQYGDVQRTLADLADLPMRAQVDALVLRALAGPTPEADADLASALALARPEGLRSPFLGWGPDLLRLVRRQPPASTAWLGILDEPHPGQGVVLPANVEPLTAREQEVLALLPTHLSYESIAERLYVSVNTAKTHIKAIYRKVGTTSREETVRIARACGLVAPEPRR